MKLFEIHTTEINGEQEYSYVHLAAAENIDRVWEIARQHALEWYDSDNPDEHKTDDENIFEFFGACLMLKIDSVSETTLKDWVHSQIARRAITEIPDALSKVEGVRL